MCARKHLQSLWKIIMTKVFVCLCVLSVYRRNLSPQKQHSGLSVSHSVVSLKKSRLRQVT